VTGEPRATPAVRQLLDRASVLRESNPDDARTIALEARVVARAKNDRPGEAEA